MTSFFKFSNIPLLIIICGLIFFPFLGEVNLFDWDETLLASVSKTMYGANEILHPLLRDDYYLAKPPLFFWLQLISFKLLGINEYAARFPNGICGLLLVLTLYKNGSRLFSRSFGMIWAIIYLSMILTQLYQRSGLAEPWFNFFIYVSLYNLTRIIEKRQEVLDGFYRTKDINQSIFWCALGAVGAMLTNGLEAPLVIWITYILIFTFSSARYGMGYINIVKWVVAVVFFSLIWIGIEYKWHGEVYLKRFFSYQWGYYVLHHYKISEQILFQLAIILIGCFPASLIAFNSLGIKTYEYTLQKVFRLTMFSSLIAILIVGFSFRDQLVHYTSYIYLPVSFFAAYSLHYIYTEKKSLKPIITFFIFLVGCVWVFLLAIVPLVQGNIGKYGNFLKEDTLKYAITNLYQWKDFETYIGITFFIFLMISIILILYKRTFYGLSVLIITVMLYSQIILLNYMPNIEQITQGAQIDFILNKKNEKCSMYYADGESYAADFYADSLILTGSGLPPESILKSKYPIYIIKRTFDTTYTSYFQQQCTKLYNQGLYTFYETNH